MTIQQLLNRSVEELEKLSDEELKKLLEPLIPEARKPDPRAALDKASQLYQQAAKLFENL